MARNGEITFYSSPRPTGLCVTLWELCLGRSDKGKDKALFRVADHSLGLRRGGHPCRGLMEPPGNHPQCVLCTVGERRAVSVLVYFLC